jgi:hypothetical protein
MNPYEAPPELAPVDASSSNLPVIVDEDLPSESAWKTNLKKAWSGVKSVTLTLGRWLVRYPLAIVAAALFLVGVSLWATYRRGDLGNLNVGGVLGWLFRGNQDPPQVTRAKVVVLSPTEGEPPTEASKAEILPAPGGPLRDKNMIRIKEEDGTVRDVRLPKGVSDTDVEQVLEVQPQEVKLKVVRKPDLNLSAEDLTHLLMVVLGHAIVGGLWVSLLFVPNLAHAQAPDCPSGYKCVPEEVAARQAAALKEYLCLQNSAGPLIELQPMVVLLAEDGTISLPPALEGSMKWCAWEYGLTAPLKVTLAKKAGAGAAAPAEPVWGFYPRWRAGLLLAPTVALDDGASKDSAWEPALLFQAFHFKAFHLNAHAGWRSGGLGLGLDLTRNLDVSAGVAVRWSSLSLAPFAGLSLALY